MSNEEIWEQWFDNIRKLEDKFGWRKVSEVSNEVSTYKNKQCNETPRAMNKAKSMLKTVK